MTRLLPDFATPLPLSLSCSVPAKAGRCDPWPLPTLKEQQAIVRQLDALRVETQKLETLYQKKIADLEELKKSVLQKACRRA